MVWSSLWVVDHNQEGVFAMSYTKLQILEEKGFVILDDYAGPTIPADEYLDLDFMDWKSGGDTNFAPLASALGEMECRGFWDSGKPDKDGVWTKNREIAPSLVRYVEAINTRYGRVRVIELNPSDEDAARKQLHADDNNRLNPDGEGWVVRAWLELDAPEGSKFILREEKDDPSTETVIPLYPGRQIVIDTERLHHVVHNPGPKPRHSLITSLESGPALQAWIDSQMRSRVSV
ncbi:MAG: hypothetical protein ACR2GX_01160 [Candidatus Dormibacteria bacterium]